MAIYKVTNNFPEEEKYSLASQIRRASISMTFNIAEGFSRYSYADKFYFYSMALGSNMELYNQMILAKDLHYIALGDFLILEKQCIIVNKLFNGLIKKSRSIHNS